MLVIIIDMKEIGGYFELEKYQGGTREYYENLLSLNIARNSLLYIIKAKKITKLYIPFYLCSVISLMLDNMNIKYDYYHIDDNFYPVFNNKLGSNEFLYIVNYYGQITKDDLIVLKKIYKNIIVDNVQAFFQKPIENIDTIYSCRKFFGVPDGSYLYTDVKLSEELDVDSSENRVSHIYGRQKDGASQHYKEFKEIDASFDNLQLMKMSNLTHDMLKKINYEKVKQTRTDNYEYLYNKLVKINKLKLKLIEGAFAYPFYIKNGTEIKKKLAIKGIYIPTLWPNVLELPNNMIEKDYAENILPLPCDQRYTTDDMQIIVDEIIEINRS